jgi:hypothetical protein
MDETVDKVEITMRKVYIIAIHPIDGFWLQCSVHVDSRGLLTNVRLI